MNVENKDFIGQLEELVFNLDKTRVKDIASEIRLRHVDEITNRITQRNEVLSLLGFLVERYSNELCGYMTLADESLNQARSVLESPELNQTMVERAMEYGRVSKSLREEAFATEIYRNFLGYQKLAIESVPKGDVSLLGRRDVCAVNRRPSNAYIATF